MCIVSLYLQIDLFNWVFKIVFLVKYFLPLGSLSHYVEQSVF